MNVLFLSNFSWQQILLVRAHARHSLLIFSMLGLCLRATYIHAFFFPFKLNNDVGPILEIFCLVVLANELLRRALLSDKFSKNLICIVSKNLQNTMGIACSSLAHYKSKYNKQNINMISCIKKKHDIYITLTLFKIKLRCY